MIEDLKVWPQGALPPSKICIHRPNFQGTTGFKLLKESLYKDAESLDSGSTVTFDISVQEGEIGYYLSRGHRLHLLKPGRHWRKPGSLDGPLFCVPLNRTELQLPEREHAEGNPPSFHLIRVDPGQVVTARLAGRPIFLTPGVDDGGHPVPGFHVFREDRTVEILERSTNKPVVQNGSSYIVTVAPGFFCKAFVNRYPLLLGAGQHMINVSGFSIPDAATAMVSINDVYIEHGVIHIVRVSPYQKFKALLHGHPIILNARTEPYVFCDATFKRGGATIDDSFVSVTDKYIEHQTLHQIRLDQGEVVLVWLNNKPLVLGSTAVFGRAAIDEYGIDLESDDDQHRFYHFTTPNFRMATDASGKPAFKLIGDERVIRHGTILIIRVRQGELCRVWNGSKPVLLEPKPEPYVFNSSTVRLATQESDGYTAFISQTEKVIEHGVHHIITVPSGKVCLVWHEGEARILGSELVSATPLPPPGSVATLAAAAPSPASSAPVAGRAKTTGGKKESEETSVARRYVIESANFRLASRELDGYSAWSNQSDKKISHGAVSIITVEDGEVAVVRNHGKRQAIGPGRYKLEAPLQVFEKHLYTGVRTSAPEEIVTYDSQRIPIRVKFTVTYEIKDASRAAQFRGKGDRDDLELFLRTACHAALRASVNHTHILEMGKGSELKRMRDMEVSESKATAAAAGGSGGGSGAMGSLFEEPAQTGSGFADQFHVAFQLQYQSLQTQLQRVGVTLIDLSMQDWSIQEPKVLSQLETLAMQTVAAQVNNARTIATCQADKLAAEGRASAEVAKAKGEAAVQQARIDAENRSVLSKAQAMLDSCRLEAESMLVKARAEANAVVKKAEAEAKAVEMKGTAEADALRKQLEALEFTPPSEWMRLMQVATAGALDGASITVSPDGLASLFSQLNAGSAVFAAMRGQAADAFGARDKVFKAGPPRS